VLGLIEFNVEGIKREGYLAVPESRNGPGILFLHAWWGLNDFFKSQCDRLASAGYLVFAPDLHHGKLASTVAEAESIMAERDFEATRSTALTSVKFLQNHPALNSEGLGAIGFSMGANFALLLDDAFPDAFSAIVLFYGGSGADLSNSHAKFLCHYAETDEFEPLDEVKKMQGPNLELYIYPGTGHWFFEENRPENYVAGAAQLAWKRSVEFFKKEIR
jgi:carboxymethylenebutenolidase